MSGLLPGASRKEKRGKPPRREEWRDTAYDPYGIYGTRSEQRIRASRRRRQVQKLTMTLACVGLVALVATRLLMPRSRLINGQRLGVALPPSAAPVAARDASGDVLLVPTESGDLLRFDPATGEARSCLDTAFPLRASPLVRDNIAFVPSENGVVSAVDWRRGKILWQRATGAPLTARPAWVENTVQIKLPSAPVAASVPTPTAGPSLQSTSPSASTPLTSPNPQPRVVTKTHNLVVVGNDAGLLAALDAGTGKIVWARRAGAPVGNAVVAAPGFPKKNSASDTTRILVPLMESAGSHGGLWCLDGKTGKVLWKYPNDNRAASPQVAPPAVDVEGGRVFCASDTGALACLNLKNGKTLWKKFAHHANPYSNEAVLLRGAPLFRRYTFGALVVVGGNDGQVRAFAADNGALLWEYNAGAPVRARPLPLTQKTSPARDLLLIGCDATRLPVLDPQNGRPVCTLRTGAPAPFGAVPAGERLCTFNTSGVVEEFVF